VRGTITWGGRVRCEDQLRFAHISGVIGFGGWFGDVSLAVQRPSGYDLPYKTSGTIDLVPPVASEHSANTFATKPFQWGSIFSSKPFRRTPHRPGERCAERARRLKPHSQRNLADASCSTSQFILRHSDPPTHQVCNRSHAQHVLEACRKTRPRHAAQTRQLRHAPLVRNLAMHSQ